jgi:ankyrin repeat protein
MSDALPLPPRPDLAQYKKLAKDLQHACRSGAIRAWAARLHGIEQTKAERIEQRWNKFRESRKLADPCALSRAQLCRAREHGFASWPKFSAALQELVRDGSVVSNFEAAADAVVTGDLAKLRRLLAEHPELATARSAREHRSTLLHYCSANGVEDFRQKSPKNSVEIAALLLDAGADVNAESEAYGGGATVFGLTATSIHPAKAGVQLPLLELFVERAAKLDLTESSVMGCLDNGQPEAAAFLVGRGAPLNPISAASIGKLDALARFIDEGVDRELLDLGMLYAACYGRRESVEFLLDRGTSPGARNDEAQTGLHWASNGGHVEIVRLLLDRGAPPDLRDEEFRATPLELAVYRWANATDAAERDGASRCAALLVDAGARLDTQAPPSDERRRRAWEKALADPAMAALHIRTGTSARTGSGAAKRPSA